MNDILLLTHAGFASALWEIAVHIYGSPPEGVSLLEISSDSDIEQIRCRLGEKIRSMEPGKGLLILNDVYGATPANLLQEWLAAECVMAITGLNLPMFMRVLSRRNLPLAEMAQAGLAGAVAGIFLVGANIPARK